MGCLFGLKVFLSGFPFWADHLSTTSERKNAEHFSNNKIGTFSNNKTKRFVLHFDSKIGHWRIIEFLAYVAKGAKQTNEWTEYMVQKKNTEKEEKKAKQ